MACLQSQPAPLASGIDHLVLSIFIHFVTSGGFVYPGVGHQGNILAPSGYLFTEQCASYMYAYDGSTEGHGPALGKSFYSTGGCAHIWSRSADHRVRDALSGSRLLFFSERSLYQWISGSLPRDVVSSPVVSGSDNLTCTCFGHVLRR